MSGAGAAPAALVVGGSAGSLGPLTTLVAALPGDLPATVLVTLHVGESHSRLASILQRVTGLPVAAAQDGEQPRPGHVYVAPPGRHLLVGPDGLALSSGPRVNRHRPAVDVLLASAAATFRERTVAVVLSGVLDDGAVGAALVARAGGVVLVQEDAEFTSMPEAAHRAAPAASSLPAAELAPHAVRRVLEPRTAPSRDPEASIMTDPLGDRTSMAGTDDLTFLGEDETRLTRLSCPECSGAMAQVDLDHISYFVCHVGHRYAPQSLAAAQAESAESKLWVAVAALEEQSAVLAYLEDSAPLRDGTAAGLTAATAAERARELRHRARTWSGTPRELGGSA